MLLTNQKGKKQPYKIEEEKKAMKTKKPEPGT